ncbi:MAG: trigger factor [Candidatus Moranbacteria bacterium]|nr:trigger factor [Candidatus Moranbacteria bacterium]
MDIKVTKLPKSRVEMEISVPWDEWKGEIDHAAQHLASEIKVEGFRPGKAPRAMLEKRLGKATVLIEGAEHAIDHLYPAALEQSKVDAIGKPEVRLDEVKDGESLRFTVTTAVMPDVTIRPWEKKVKSVNEDHRKAKHEVSAEDVEKALRDIAESRAKQVAVAREARESDVVLVDFVVRQGGVPIEGGTSKKHPIVLGKGAFIPGFEEAILGMKEGEEKTVSLTFPEKYHIGMLAGKPADFHVKVIGVQERQIPELDDAFASSLGKFESIAKLRENVAEGMRIEKENEAKEKRRIAILEAILGEAEAEIPEALVEGELRRMISEFGSQAAMAGMTLEDYLARGKKTEKDLANEWRPQAEKRILSGLALDMIAKEREIEAVQEEIEAEMNKVLAYAKSIEKAEKDLDLAAIYDAARSRLRNEKLFELLENL